MTAQPSAAFGNSTLLYNFIQSKPGCFIDECKKAGIYSLSEVEPVRILKKERPNSYAILAELAHAKNFPE